MAETADLSAVYIGWTAEVTAWYLASTLGTSSRGNVSNDGSNSSMSHAFDDPLLHDFMQSFYGYGNFQGAYWFIGMEEGGGACRPAGTLRRKTLHCLRG